MWPHVLPDQYSHAIFLSITYIAKFSLVFNFTYFAKFQPFVKLFQRKFVTHTLQLSRARVSMDNILELCCCIRKGRSPIRYLQSIGIGLLTDASSSTGDGVECACMPCPYYITLWYAHGLDSEFAAKLPVFQQNLQKPPLARI